MRNLLIAVVGMGLVAWTAPAWSAPLTLHDCITQAVANSPDLSSVRHLIKANKADITKKRGTQLPYLSGEVQGYMVNGQPVSQFSSLNLFDAAGGTGIAGAHGFLPQAHWNPVGIEELTLAYPLFYQGSILGLNDPPPVAASRATMTENQAAALVTEQKVIFNVVTAYLNAASYQNQSDLQQQVADAYQRQLNVQQAEERVGLKLPQDVAIAQEQLDAARQDEEILRETAYSNKVQLASLIGRGVDQGTQIDSTEPTMLKLPPLDQFLREVVPNNPSLQVEQAKVEIQRQQVRVDKVGYWPTVTLDNQFLAGQDLEHFNGGGQGDTHLRPTLFQSYLTIEQPIFDFGQRYAANQESKENLLAAKDELRATDASLRTSITQVYGQIGEFGRVVAAADSTALQLQKQADQVRAQRAAGSVDELTLVNAEVAEANARVAVETARLLVRLQYASLQNLAGGNWLWVQ